MLTKHEYGVIMQLGADKRRSLHEGRTIMFIIIPTITRLLGLAGLAYLATLFANGTMGNIWEAILGLFN